MYTMAQYVDPGRRTRQLSPYLPGDGGDKAPTSSLPFLGSLGGQEPVAGPICVQKERERERERERDLGLFKCYCRGNFACLGGKVNS